MTGQSHALLTEAECSAAHGDIVNGSCMICDGGLALCKVCKGAEITLATECPGVPLTGLQEDQLTRGTIDFVDGVWKRTGKRT